MTKIKEDSHGFYVKIGVHLFRPVFSVVYQNKYDDKTIFVLDEDVITSQHNGTPLGSVETCNNSEIWFSHGRYEGKNSEDLYKPKGTSW